MLLNTYSKLWNMCYKLCNKLFLADSENYHVLRKNFLADSKKRKAESKCLFLILLDTFFSYYLKR